MQYGDVDIKTETWKIPVFALSDKVFKRAIGRFPSRPLQRLSALKLLHLFQPYINTHTHS